MRCSNYAFLIGERINVLGNRKAIIEIAHSGKLNLNEDDWNFITTKYVDETLPFLLNESQEIMKNEKIGIDTTEKFYKSFIGYIDTLPTQKIAAGDNDKRLERQDGTNSS